MATITISENTGADFTSVPDAKIVDYGGDTNFGSDVSFWVAYERNLIRFDGLSDSSLDGSTVSSSAFTLKKPYDSSGGSVTIEIAKLATAFVESTVTWNTSDVGSATVIGTFVYGGTGDIVITGSWLDSYIQDVIDGTEPNNGLVLRATSGYLITDSGEAGDGGRPSLSFVITAGSGTTHYVSITESGAATDISSNTATFISNLIESASAIDSSSNTNVTSSAITESGAASDSASVSINYNDAITESATADESEIGVVLNLAEQLEAVTANDLLTNTLITNAIIIESVSAIESAIAQILQNASINEILSASDTSLSSIITQAIISENGNALESVDGLIINLAIQNESTSASDLITNILISNATIGESAGATDSVLVELLINTEIIEAASASDSSSSQLNVTINIRKSIMTLAYESRIYVLPKESRIYKDNDYV